MTQFVLQLVKVVRKDNKSMDTLVQERGPFNSDAEARQAYRDGWDNNDPLIRNPWIAKHVVDKTTGKVVANIG